ncbi:galactokinase isoform X2 [Halyomorpha halys]|uniref:galactokinase isoform X2 n=1 Tax=Halyomorpha halys TaxID=286706 RepID=UPI0006D509E9|nr:galactokinase-like isoform X2 [Halyomorpha halys]
MIPLSPVPIYGCSGMCINREYCYCEEMAEKQFALEDLIRNACQCFKKQFNDIPTHAASAPGRVNIIGEHTDYNNGFVFPMALPLITVVVGKLNNSNNINIYSMTEDLHEPSNVTFKVPKDNYKLTPGSPKWANYCKGVVANFKGNVPGFNAVVISTVPVGGGVSSSASLEVATYTFLEALTGVVANQTEKALACQKAEHEFANMPCGIMDQYASVFCKENSILLLDCGMTEQCHSGDAKKCNSDPDITAPSLCTTRSQEMKHVDYTDPNIVFLVTNSNVKHKLSGSEYPTRRKQCQDAAHEMKVETLRDADISLLEEHKSSMDPTVYRRARHVITEISRTLEAVEALKEKKYRAFGYLMLQSHISLSYDFEVSCKELDDLVNIAMKTNGVYGSRMTGGGFGGCTVTLLETCAVDEVIKNIRQDYKGNPRFYIAKPSGGAADQTMCLKEIVRRML